MSGATAPANGSIGEVRYDDAADAARALGQLNGSFLGGSVLEVSMHMMNNPTQTKLLVKGVPQGYTWQELKDHFRRCGTVGHAKIYGQEGKAGGKGQPGMIQGVLPGVNQADAARKASASLAASIAAQQAGAPRGFHDAPPPASDASSVASPSGATAPAGDQPMDAGTKRGFDEQDPGMMAKSQRVDGQNGQGLGPPAQPPPMPPPSAVPPQHQMPPPPPPMPAPLQMQSTAPAPSLPMTAPHVQSTALVAVAPPQSFSVAPPAPVAAAAACQGFPGMSTTIGVCDVKYAESACAQMAVQMLNGTSFRDSTISVMLDQRDSEMKTLIVGGFGGDADINQLRDLFATIGTITECNHKSSNTGAVVGPVPGVAPGFVATPDTSRALVRFFNRDQANRAVQLFHGLELDGAKLMSWIEPASIAGTKIRISGLPGHTDWLEIKDFCQQAGSITFCEVEKDDGAFAPPPGTINAPRAAVPLPDTSMLKPKPAPVIIPPSAPAPAAPDLSSMMLGGVPHLDLTGGMGGLAGLGGFVGFGGSMASTMMAGGMTGGIGGLEGMAGLAGCGGGLDLGLGGGLMGGIPGLGGLPPGLFGMPGFDGGLAGLAGLPPGLAGIPGLAGLAAQGGGPAAGGLAGGKLTGEVRYDDPEHAKKAIELLQGTIIGGVPVGVHMHGMKNPTLTKLLITGLPANTHWSTLKNHFATIGTVAFANVLDGNFKGKKGDKGEGKGKGISTMENKGKGISVPPPANAPGAAAQPAAAIVPAPVPAAAPAAE